MKYDFSKCPRCGAPTEKAQAISGDDSTFWLTCTRCNTYIDTYIPQPHQYAFHSDPHKIKGNFGGYGSGKTLTDQKEVAKHMLITPKANVLIGANVSHQYEQTIKRELEADLPLKFIHKYHVQDKYMDLENRSRLMWRSFDDPGKLRSLNLSMYLIVEGSETTNEVFTQLNTRLRSTAAIVFEEDEYGNPIVNTNPDGSQQFIIKHDWRQGVIESNPDSGYIRTDVLLFSDQIHQFGMTPEQYDQDESTRDPLISSYVTATRANKYLPADYEDTFKNRPDWWKRRYLKGSFQFSEGLVYPSYFQTIVSPFEIPKHWLRMVAHDYGLSDRAVFVFAAIDPKEGTVYIYKQIATENMDIDQLAALYKEGAKDIPEGGLAFPPLIDPKSGPKRDYHKKSLMSEYLERGIYFEPGTVSVNTRVLQMNSYINSGKLKIFDTCEELIGELREYKFPPKSLDKDGGKNMDKPMDKNNHSINPVEWIVTRLPRDPRNVLHSVYNQKGETLESVKEKVANTSWQLADMGYNELVEEDPFELPSFNIFEI